MLASIFSVASNIGLPLIFVIVIVETGCGIPVAPGETAVLTGGLLASQHKLNLYAVMAVAASAAILGDNIGYMIGRIGGRALLEKPGPFARQRQMVLGVADPFFEKHGNKAVFIGRWLPILRIYASWMAGGARMPWRTFLVWNASGGVFWAVGHALLGYYVGASAQALIRDIGAYAILIIVVVAVITMLVVRRLHRQQQHVEAEPVAVEEPTIKPTIEPPV